LPNGKIHIAQLLSQKEAERQGGGCLGDVELVTRECQVGNVNFAIWQSGLGKLIKSTWQISQIEKCGVGNWECQDGNVDLGDS